MKAIIIIVLGLMLNSITVFSQNSSGWLALYGNDKLKDNLSLYYEGQYRNHKLFNHRSQLLLRTGLGWSFTENNNKLLIGYGFINSKDEICFEINPTPQEREIYRVNEHRIYQQFIKKQELNRVLLKHRFRLEQRFLKEGFSQRFRYFSNFILSLNNENVTEKTLYISAYNETFLNLDVEVFDRNRIYGGLGYALTENLKVEIGYLNQYFDGVGENVIMVSLFNNKDFKFFSL